VRKLLHLLDHKCIKTLQKHLIALESLYQLCRCWDHLLLIVAKHIDFQEVRHADLTEYLWCNSLVFDWDISCKLDCTLSQSWTNLIVGDQANDLFVDDGVESGVKETVPIVVLCDFAVLEKRSLLAVIESGLFALDALYWNVTQLPCWGIALLNEHSHRVDFVEFQTRICYFYERKTFNFDVSIYLFLVPEICLMADACTACQKLVDWHVFDREFSCLTTIGKLDDYVTAWF